MEKIENIKGESDWTCIKRIIIVKESNVVVQIALKSFTWWILNSSSRICAYALSFAKAVMSLSQNDKKAHHVEPGL